MIKAKVPEAKKVEAPKPKPVVQDGGEGLIAFQMVIDVGLAERLEAERRKRGFRSRAETIRVLLGEALAK